MIENVNMSLHLVTHRGSRLTILDPVQDGPVLPKGSLLEIGVINYDSLMALLGNDDITYPGSVTLNPSETQYLKLFFFRTRKNNEIFGKTWSVGKFPAMPKLSANKSCIS